MEIFGGIVIGIIVLAGLAGLAFLVALGKGMSH